MSLSLQTQTQWWKPVPLSPGFPKKARKANARGWFRGWFPPEAVAQQHSMTPHNGAEHQLEAYLLNHVFRALHLIPAQGV